MSEHKPGDKAIVTGRDHYNHHFEIGSEITLTSIRDNKYFDFTGKDPANAENLSQYLHPNDFKWVEFKPSVGDRVILPSGRHGKIVDPGLVYVQIDGGKIEAVHKTCVQPEPEEREYLISCQLLTSGATPEEAAVNFVQLVVDLIEEGAPLTIAVEDANTGEKFDSVDIERDLSHEWEYGCKTA